MFLLIEGFSLNMLSFCSYFLKLLLSFITEDIEYFNTTFEEYKVVYPTEHLITRFFYKQRNFSTQPQCCLTRIELQMLHSCCLIHKSIIILRHFLYLLYLCPCLDLGLFVSHLCDIFFVFIFIFIMITCIISWI